jgi:signal transduction histidine kinase/ligand-binding sensor domain-containing protein
VKATTAKTGHALEWLHPHRPASNCVRRSLVVFGLCLAIIGLNHRAFAAAFDNLAGSAVVGVWTVEDGLPGNAVTTIVPTRDGYLWVGGFNGLARFDGIRFVRFRLWEGLTSLLIHTMLEDRDGRLWIGTVDGGLMVRQADQFRSFTRKEGLPGESVRALTQDSRGTIWAATEGGVARLDGSRFVDCSPPGRDLKPQGAHSIVCGENSVWVVGQDYTVWELREGTWRPLPRLGKQGFRFERLFVRRDGSLWAQLHPHFLARLEGNHWSVLGAGTGLPDNYIYSVLEQADSSLWCGSFERGLFVLRDGLATAAGMNKAPELDGFFTLQEDQAGNIWAGTRTRGLLQLRSPRVATIAGSDVVRIARVAHDTQGRFWIGGDTGLWYGQPGQLEPVYRPQRKISVISMVPDNAGGVWFGTLRGGLWHYDPDHESEPVQVLKSAEGNQTFTALAADGVGGVWFGTEGGKAGRTINRSTTVFAVPSKVPRQRVSCLWPELANDAASSSNAVSLWAGTESSGAVHFDASGQVLSRLTTDNGLPNNTVRSLIRDREGDVWIGTPAGLGFWRQGKLQIFDTRNGLPEDSVASLVQDDAGHIWCTANNWVFRLDKKDCEAVATGRAARVQPLALGRSDGLKPSPFAASVPPATMRDPRGWLVFPRMWNVLTFDPATFAHSARLPRPVIEEVSIDGMHAAPPTAGAPLKIGPGHGLVQIRYTGLQSTSPERLRFRYRFDGLDEGWSEVGEQRLASLRRLPPGSYRFELSASAAPAHWAQPAASLTLLVQPYFWQTTWFRMVVLLAAVSLAAIFVWWRIRRIEHRHLAQEAFARQLLEQGEIERRRIAAELHDGLGQNLIIVKNLALLDQLGGANESKVTPRLAEIAAATDRALEEVHSISYALRPPELDRLGLAKALAGLVRRAGEASGIRFEPHIEFNGELPAGSDIQLFRIAQEAVNNLVKHSGAKTARVELWRDEGGVHLVIADDGRGLHSHKTSDGRQGLGLSGIEERAHLISAQCKWLSAPGQGTTLSLLLPTNG